ncbi:MAG: hypothetical protein ACFCVF_10530 [Kineosporiaceae bacterium]
MRASRRFTAILVLVPVVTVALAACSDGADDAGGGASSTPVGAPGTSTAASTGASPSVTEGLPTATVTSDDAVGGDGGTGDEPFPADTAADTADPRGDQVLFTDFRIGRQDGFDRVVWEFAGSGRPGWAAAYADSPSRQGSGAPVDLPGDATLEVLIGNVGIPGDVEVPEGTTPYDGPPARAASGTAAVTEVVVGGTFEGTHDAFVGVTEEAPFRVYLLTDPTRVVLEIRNP